MNAAAGRRTLAIRIAASIAGFCTFINLYSPQAILPLLSQEFGATARDISAIITASTLAVAIIAPFSGTVADVVGRKRVIVTAMVVLAIPTVFSALAGSLHALVFWRFVQGLAMPPVFAVTVAYIGEELSPKEATAVTGFYTSGSSLGGFTGRLLTGALADAVNWRFALMTLAALTVVGAVVVAKLLPRERHFVKSAGLVASGKQMLGHFRNPQLLATYAVGFGVLFNFLATFTYISFRLAAPPYNMSPTLLGIIFVTYLSGTALTPMTGRFVSRFGRRAFVQIVIAIWLAGVLLTLLGPVWVILIGLSISACCGMLCQAVSTGYVTITAQVGRSSAVGLYVTSFYLGGSFGAALGGIAWTLGGWPACVAMIAAMLAVMAAIVAITWRTPPQPAPQS
ncbi:MAG TPA: MFS transporter [Pseudolabrys sp.]|jgi:YNFM family putative membrane transporter|nr:MFS transporter [Pseudolabrys sp.]